VAHIILRYKRSGAPPASDVEEIRAVPGLTVLDDAGRMLLVDLPESEIPKLSQSIADWSVSREESVPLPDTRPSVRKPSS